MKKTMLRPLLVLFALALLALNACKKPSTNDTDDSVSSGDASAISAALNSTTNDADNAFSTNNKVSGKTQGLVYESLCNATATIDTVAGKGSILYTTGGTDCSGTVTRSGTITITLENYPAVHWSDSGAILAITYSNVAVTLNGYTYTFNGTQYIINVSGGLAWKVMDGVTPNATVVRKHVADNVSVSFPNNTTRTWSFRRSRTFTDANNTPTITQAGDTTINGISNTESWGTDRLGESFQTEITSPISSNYNCGFFHPTTGSVTHQVANRSVTVTYGVDQNGHTEPSGTCPYGYQITYTKGTKTVTAVFP